MADPITITGNIATAPTQQRTNAGAPFTRFRVASPNRRRDPQTGEWADLEPNWYTVYAYRGLAENAVASLSKGQRVIASGTLKVRRWERDERSGTEVEVYADSLGADLRFGRTTFTRVGSGALESAERADPPGNAPQAASGDVRQDEQGAWAAPGDESWTAADVPETVDGSGDDETPF
ncbi:single-stranded DNA-binding protein [Microbacterium sp. G2-8]|uniref:single-stranded DNA-binding protein n=1 Tax=Microbacterium sp. G2-8 TaxID=2842454 RepID=UPI001C8A76C6|nr:single-stranded DNA-binding protein [Microbacterium sp. G2-8]